MIFFLAKNRRMANFFFSKWNILSKIPCFSFQKSPESYRIGEGSATFLATGYSYQRFLKQIRQLSRNLPRDARHPGESGKLKKKHWFVVCRDQLISV
jgi:hypothetical protein